VSLAFYLDDRWMTAPKIAEAAFAAPWIRGLTVTVKVGDIQPDGPESSDWTALDAAVAQAVAAGKFIRFAIKGTDHLVSGRIPTWMEADVVSVPDAGNDARIVLWKAPWPERWLRFITDFGARYCTTPRIGFLNVAGMNGGGEMTILRRGIADYRRGGYTDVEILDGLRSVWMGSAIALREAFGDPLLAVTPGPIVMDRWLDGMDVIAADLIAAIGLDRLLWGNASYNLGDHGATIDFQRKIHKQGGRLSAHFEQPARVDGSLDPDPIGTLRTVLTYAARVEGIEIGVLHSDAGAVDPKLTTPPWVPSAIAGYPGNLTPILTGLAD
jgi:hypothetical protein